MEIFFSNMKVAAEQVIVLYLIVAVGFVADKSKIFTEKTAKLCTGLLMNIVTSCVIIESFMTLEYSANATKSLFTALGCGFLLHTVAALISNFTFKRTPQERACIFRYASAYGNCGYMGLPLANAVFGSEGVFYCSAVIISFQIFCFTHGVYLMNKGKTEGRPPINIKTLLLNPGVLSVAIGLPIYLSRIALPDLIIEPVSYIGSLNTPLAMLIFGTYLANTDFKSIFKEWRILGVAGLKLILQPLPMLGIFRLLGISGTLLGSLVVPASAPPATNTAIFAAKYDRDTGLASQVVSVVSLMSIITMPIIIALSQTAW